jgi:hypothetical protein
VRQHLRFAYPSTDRITHLPTLKDGPFAGRPGLPSGSKVTRKKRCWLGPTVKVVAAVELVARKTAPKFGQAGWVKLVLYCNCQLCRVPALQTNVRGPFVDGDS